MGGAATKKQQTRVVPQFTVTILVDGTPIVSIDVCEEATLADARHEILLESEDFTNLPKKYHFSRNGAPFSLRKETQRTVREFAGSDSRLTLIPIKEDVLNTSNTALEKTINIIDTIDEVNNTVVENTTEERQTVQQDGTITKEDEIETPSFITLDDTSNALLNDVLDGIEVVSEVIPFAKLLVTTCKAIYDRCQEPDRLRAEIQEFLDFVQLIEKSIIKGLNIFQETEPLRIINTALMKGDKIIDESQKRTGFMAWWSAKTDREALIDIKGEIMEAMKIAQFTMQIDTKEDIVKLLEKDDALRNKFSGTSEEALKMLFDDGNATLKDEILQHLNLKEDELNNEFNEIMKGIEQLDGKVDKSLQNQAQILQKLDIATSLKAVLDPLDFNLEINGAVERFHDGTREWAFQDFDNWVETKLNSRVFVLSGDAGMGKTGIMSMLVRTRVGIVIAHHFCRHDDSRKRDPKHVLCSIAYQLAEKIPEYRKKIEELVLTSASLSELNVTGLFDKILRAPLVGTKCPETFQSTRQIILIDALDECDHNGKNDLLDCIRDHFLELPEWIGFFLTTRPEVDIMKKLGKFHPEQLMADSEKNMNDIQLYIGDALEGCILADDLKEGVSILSNKSNGVFIYARYAVEKLNMQSGQISLEELKDFPDGINGFYDIQFRRLFGSEYEGILNNSAMWRIVEAVMAAEEPIHVEALDYLIQCKPKERKVAVAKLSLVFPIRDRKLHVFHKSVKDWLVTLDRKEEICYVDVDNEIHEKIGRRCHALLNESLTYNEKKKIMMEKVLVYSLKHCVTHLCKGGMVKVARELMFQFEYLLERAKLGPEHMLVKDCVQIAGSGGDSIRDDRALSLLQSALILAQNGLRKSPLQIAGQLYGRLMGYGKGVEEGGGGGSQGGGGSNEGKKMYVKDIDVLLKKVKSWKGPKGGKGWWCPMQQTYEPAGGNCLHTLVGHGGEVYCSAFNHDGTKIVSGS
eukprot:g6174.t1